MYALRLFLLLGSYGFAHENPQIVLSNEAGRYDGDLRPQIHFSPYANWMNDPNGLFIDGDQIWHLYYQYNPESIWPNGWPAWGHATSKNLYSWEVQPIAIPVSRSTGSPWTGSIVIDTNNTSNLFPQNQNNGVVAIYTNTTDPEEAQAIAYSSDNGYHFTLYEGNPVISLGQRGFRDPKVLWHAETKKWVMVVSHADDGFVSFYTSENLKRWKLGSHFALPSLTRTSFECPNIVQIPMTGYTSSVDLYVLLISFGAQSPFNHGSVTRYFPGTFNGTHFTTFDNRTDRFIDFGPDNYAAQFFHNTPAGDPLISIAWAVNLAYSADTPTGWREGWRGMMTLPRQHFLANISERGYELVSRPYNLSPIFDAVIAHVPALRDGKSIYGYHHLPSGTVLFEANFTLLPSAAELLKFNPLADRPSAHVFEFAFASSVSGERVVCRLDFSPSRPSVHNTTQPDFLCNRSLATRNWDNSRFVPRMSRPLLAPMQHMQLTSPPSFQSPLHPQTQPHSQTQWCIEAIMDRSILEVFLNRGEDVGTMTMFPENRLDLVVVSADGLEGIVDVSIRVTGLRSGWAMASASAPENESAENERDQPQPRLGFEAL